MNSGLSFGEIRRQNRKKTDSFSNNFKATNLTRNKVFRLKCPRPSVFRLKWFLVGILRLENTFSHFKKAFSREIKSTACKAVKNFEQKPV